MGERIDRRRTWQWFTLVAALILLTHSMARAESGKIVKEAPAPPEDKKKSNVDPPLVGAYYYSWYNLEDQWARYPKPDTPLLGEYDLKKNEGIISQHHQCVSLLLF